jgi:hypothetical protein
MGHSVFECVIRDFVKYNAMCCCRIQFQNLTRVPGNGLAFTIVVGSEIDFDFGFGFGFGC